MKRIYRDVETKGIPLPQSGLIQLAGAIEIPGAKPKFFHYRIKPFPGDVIEAEALEVNGITRDQLKTYPAPTACTKRS